MTPRPNILFLMTDQQRGDCLGIEGHPVLQTPNLDAIAAEGVRFAHAYSTCPSCVAARRSLLSGQFPPTHGLVGFQTGVPWEPEATMPGELAKAGYQSFFVGRPMHQFPRRRRYGYDHMVFSGDHAPPSPDDPSGHGLTANGWTARPWHLDESRHPAYQTATEAVRFLTQTRDPHDPFFLTVSFLAPHPPLYPPAFYMQRYLDRDLPEPVIGDWATPPAAGERGFGVDTDRVDLRGEALKRCLAGYFGLIDFVDAQVCRVLRALGTDPANGRLQLHNTIIVFTSDHGEMLGDHHLFRKTYPYEASARVPLLVRLPASFGVEPGQVIDRPVCLEDLMPTLLDLAGAPIPDCVDGQSVIPLMRNADAPWRDWLHGEHANRYGPHQANHYLTDGHEKFIWFSDSGREQLFDLDADPQECHDLAADPTEAPDRVKLWRDRLIAELGDRPEGFSDGGRLIPGRPHRAIMPGSPADVSATDEYG